MLEGPESLEGPGILAVRVVDLARASVEESPRLQASVTGGRKPSFYLLVAARSAGHSRRRPRWPPPFPTCRPPFLMAA